MLDSYCQTLLNEQSPHSRERLGGLAAPGGVSHVRTPLEEFAAQRRGDQDTLETAAAAARASTRSERRAERAGPTTCCR